MPTESPATLLPALSPTVRPVRPDRPGGVVSPAAVLGREVAAEWRATVEGRAARLVGPALNLLLGVGYLAWTGVGESSGRMQALVVGAGLASFVLSDSAAGNALGADRHRVRSLLAAGVGLRRILAVKNLVLVTLVSLPVLAVAAALTLTDGTAADLAVVLPGVLVPMLLLTGLGNLVSVLLPVGPVALRHRWRRRADRRGTLRWLVGTGVCWSLWLAVDPVSDLIEDLDRRLGSLGPVDSVALGAALLLSGLTARGALTRLAVQVAGVDGARLRARLAGC